jgi:hypothetical protein
MINFRKSVAGFLMASIAAILVMSSASSAEARSIVSAKSVVEVTVMATPVLAKMNVPVLTSSAAVAYAAASRAADFPPGCFWIVTGDVWNFWAFIQSEHPLIAGTIWDEYHVREPYLDNPNDPNEQAQLFMNIVLGWMATWAQYYCQEW